MSSLRRLCLKGFKSIREMNLELGALNVLIGAGEECARRAAVKRVLLLAEGQTEETFVVEARDS